jgi:hypothetical protein
MGCVDTTASFSLRIGAALMTLALPCVAGAAPVLYGLPAFQSPVRAEPDDLLLLAGDGLSAKDTVVYVALGDTTQIPSPPTSVPKESTEHVGVTPVVSTANVPYSLTVRLPKVMRRDQSYALWVRSHAEAWSNPIRINDARPLWITPAYAYATRAVADLPRYIKVVGRNLQRAPGAVTKVRLEGPERIELDAADDGDESTAIERYAAIATLPARLQPGEYVVSVTRDGIGWLPLNGQKFIVRSDPMRSAEFPVGTHGCRPDDGSDDTRCIVQAIHAAHAAGGGAVVFDAGTWELTDPTVPGVMASAEGIIVPRGVDLRGAGSGLTTLLTDASWSAQQAQALFTLEGRNDVRGITFRDARRHRPNDVASVAMLRLGKSFYRLSATEPRHVDDIVITRNVFDKPRVAISDGGLPIRRLFVTYNTFGAYDTGLAPGGDRYNLMDEFRLDESVIAHNVFKPGSYLDVGIGQGAIASTLGAAFRVDFSDNVADGASTEYLSARPDAAGWRAAFFWHLNGNQELLLVSRNKATCTGDKVGDGEAIAFDNNGNTFAFDGAATVLDATANTVTVDAALASRQNQRSISRGDYYVGHWMQIGQGRGLGQSRKIVSYRADADSARVTFTVSPAWEVPPEQGRSRVTIARQLWQTFTVDNLVDHRSPPCRKSNRMKPKGGVIGYWAQSADSVIEGNRQYDTDGLIFQQSYSARDRTCPQCDSWTLQQWFLDVRGNTIDGEYDWQSDCSHSGIFGSHSASPTPSSPPPVSSYGVTIAHNTIRHADAFRGGAIGVALTWHQGPAPHNWNVVDNMLIHHNSIVDIDGRGPIRKCDIDQRSRIGINLHQSTMVWGTVLYANSCVNVTTAIQDTGSATVRVCPSPVSGSCECVGTTK